MEDCYKSICVPCSAMQIEKELDHQNIPARRSKWSISSVFFFCFYEVNKHCFTMSGCSEPLLSISFTEMNVQFSLSPYLMHSTLARKTKTASLKSICSVLMALQVFARHHSSEQRKWFDIRTVAFTNVREWQWFLRRKSSEQHCVQPNASVELSFKQSRGTTSGSLRTGGLIDCIPAVTIQILVSRMESNHSLSTSVSFVSLEVA